MIPWEREIYLGLLQNYIKQENQRRQQQEAQQRARG
tara:strand:+ start:1149 stop:1256 length:108 start_codon:yes stop_codon:yes gene_type:complete